MFHRNIYHKYAACTYIIKYTHHAAVQRDIVAHQTQSNATTRSRTHFPLAFCLIETLKYPFFIHITDTHSRIGHFDL